MVNGSVKFFTLEPGYHLIVPNFELRATFADFLKCILFCFR